MPLKRLNYKKKGVDKFFHYLKDLEIHSMYEKSGGDLAFISAKKRGKHHFQLFMLKNYPIKSGA